MANWEHEEGVSQRLAELITSEKVSRKLQRKSTKAITQGMSDISHYYKSQLQNIISEPAIAYNKIYVECLRFNLSTNGLHFLFYKINMQHKIILCKSEITRS